MSMIMSKYGAIKEFFNKFAEHLNLENVSAKNFKEIVNQHLEFILPFCAKTDKVPSNVISQALSILGKSTFIPYLNEINSTLAAKDDEEEIGKILVGVFYELRVRQWKTVEKVIQSMNVDCRLEIIHIIKFLEQPEYWPPNGSWAAILRMAPPVELQEEWEDHESSILGDITNAEPDRRQQSAIMRTPLSRTQGKQKLMTAHRSPLHILMQSPIGQERMRIAELEKEIVAFKKKNLELLQQIQDIAEETDREHDDLKHEITNIKIEKSDLESTKRHLENELDAANLNVFEFQQRCNEQSADLINLTKERDKLAKERDSLKNNITTLVKDYESSVKTVAALEKSYQELNERLRKKKIDYADLEESYANLRKEMREVELLSVAKREEYAAVVRAKYEAEIAALKKSVETAAADAVEKAKKEKAELEARLAEVTVASEKAVKEADAKYKAEIDALIKSSKAAADNAKKAEKEKAELKSRLAEVTVASEKKVKEISEKAKRDAEGFFKDLHRAKEEIEKQKLELVDCYTAIAELDNDLEEQETACATHEADLATAQEQVAQLEAEKIARQEGAKALRNLPFSLSKHLPMPTIEPAAPTTKSVESHSDYLDISTGSIDGLSLDGAPLTIQDFFIDPPQNQAPRPSIATVFTTRFETPQQTEFVSSTPRMSLSKSARKSISRMFKHRNHHN